MPRPGGRSLLRLPPFELRSPASVAEAAAILADVPDARVVAGGTDLWPNLKRGQEDAGTVVSLTPLPELGGIDSGRADRELRIGATATLSAVAGSRPVRERYPALARAAAAVSSPPLRNLGTLGGNLCLDTRCTYYNQSEAWRRAVDYCLKRDGDVCWVAPRSSRCWAHTAGDSAPVLCALGARVCLTSSGGERTIPVEQLFRDDGVAFLAKRRDEIVTGILLPADADRTRCGSAFRKLRRRGSIDFAVLSVAAAVWSDGAGRVERARVVLGAVASRPARAEDAERALLGEPLTQERIERAARLARRAASPLDNTDFQAQWRGRMVEAYTAAALREAAGLDPGVDPRVAP